MSADATAPNPAGLFFIFLAFKTFIRLNYVPAVDLCVTASIRLVIKSNPFTVEALIKRLWRTSDCFLQMRRAESRPESSIWAPPDRRILSLSVCRLCVNTQSAFLPTQQVKEAETFQLSCKRDLFFLFFCKTARLTRRKTRVQKCWWFYSWKRHFSMHPGVNSLRCLKHHRPNVLTSFIQN